MESIRNRKGATKAANIPEEVLSLLNLGEIESVNLTEWLAVDQKILLKNVLPTVGGQEYLNDLVLKLEAASMTRGMKAIRTLGENLHEILVKVDEETADQIFSLLANHPSDSVRCWAAFIVGSTTDIGIDQLLIKIRKFAADHHFGVREIAWMAVREALAKDLMTSIELLKEWAKDSDENIRRFAVESIRPRGVWCKHIERLKNEPQIALPVLEQVKSDEAKYVQDSIGNWLNDASKTQPEWVISICEEWEKISDTKETKRIVKKAKRTITKNQ
ncbi:DNA alkylation repair protein [Bacillus sp. FJAT-52991]|uniref:DNA alkylation repair protein n=1 Tax=Bacillus kandeliae TaxID=3129297 RepID=A0ABZ2N7Z6_9BACI